MAFTLAQSQKPSSAKGATQSRNVAISRKDKAPPQGGALNPSQVSGCAIQYVALLLATRTYRIVVTFYPPTDKPPPFIGYSSQRPSEPHRRLMTPSQPTSRQRPQPCAQPLHHAHPAPPRNPARDHGALPRPAAQAPYATVRHRTASPPACPAARWSTAPGSPLSPRNPARRLLPTTSRRTRHRAAHSRRTRGGKPPPRPFWACCSPQCINSAIASIIARPSRQNRNPPPKNLRYSSRGLMVTRLAVCKVAKSSLQQCQHTFRRAHAAAALTRWGIRCQPGNPSAATADPASCGSTRNKCRTPSLRKAVESKPSPACSSCPIPRAFESSPAGCRPGP